MALNLSRREALAGGGLLALAGCTAPVALAPARAGGLDAIARRSGRRFGSAVSWGPPGADRGSFANPAYAALLERECGIVVAENEMKWQALRPSADTFNFAPADAILAWAEAHNMTMRGHNLLWHRVKWMPGWEERHDFGARPASEAERLLVDHITTVLRRYRNRIHSWDVVNEAVDPETGGLEPIAISRALGSVEASVDLAFHTARAAAPEAQLVYNDYMSWEADNEKHRAGVLRLLEGFRRRGTPVDALGVQSHLITDGTDVAATVARQTPEWRRFLDAVRDMGYDLLITELDVRDNGLPADTAVRDRAVADYTRAYLDLMFDYPSIRDVLCWGLSDRYSWLGGYDLRSDGVARRGCPYDAALQPVPMRDAIAASLAAAPPRG